MASATAAVLARDCAASDSALGLRRLLAQVVCLKPAAGIRLRERIWNSVCSKPHLVALLDRATVRALLNHPAQHPTNRILLLRAHPDADHRTARQIWRSADLTARRALDVLRATGPAKRRLVDDALEHGAQARYDDARAARLCAAIVAATDAGDADLLPLAGIIGDANLPAGVRAVAAYLADPAELPGDAVFERYRLWLRGRPVGASEPLTDLLSGAWQSNALL